MKEHAAFIIALFLFFVGLQGQPRNQNAIQNRERLEDSILKSAQLLENVCQVLQNREGESSSSHSSKLKSLVSNMYSDVKNYLSKENYILQNIFLRMKIYKITDYSWLSSYIQGRNEAMEGLRMNHLRVLSGQELEQYILTQFYRVVTYLNKTKNELEEKIQTGTADLVIYYKKEMKLLDNVQSFLKKDSTNQFREPSTKDIINVVYVTWLTFWMSLHFRVYSIYSSNLMKNFENKATFDSYFEAMMWAFDSLKSEIDGFNEKNPSCFPLNYNSDESDIQFVINELLKLNLDFVLTEDDLEKKYPGKYKPGIIKYNVIEQSEIGGLMYKTIFPSDTAITKFFGTGNFDDIDVMKIQSVYQIFNQKISKVINGNKLKKIEHFFMKKVFGTKRNSSEKKYLTNANKVTWLNSLVLEPKQWATLKGQNLSSEIHTPGGQRQTVDLIKFLKQTEQDTLTNFITAWRELKIIPYNQY